MKRIKAVSLSFLLVTLSGCAGGNQAAKNLLEEIANAAFNFKKLAFVQFDPQAIGPLLSCLRPLAIVCVLAFSFVLVQSYSRGERVGQAIADRHYKWLVFLVLLGMPAMVFSLVHDLGLRLWPDELTFNFVRTTLGWTVPVIEAMPKIDPFILPAFSSIPLVLGWHMAFEATLLVTLPLFVILGVLLRNLRIVLVWVVAWACWVAFGPLWHLSITVVGSSNLAFFLTTSMLVLVLSVTPLVAAVMLPLGSEGGSSGSSSRHSSSSSSSETAWELLQTGAILYAGHRAAQAAEASRQRRTEGRESVIYGYPPRAPGGELPPARRMLPPPRARGGQSGPGRGDGPVEGPMPSKGQVPDTETPTHRRGEPLPPARPPEGQAALAEEKPNGKDRSRAGEKLPATTSPPKPSEVMGDTGEELGEAAGAVTAAVTGQGELLPEAVAAGGVVGQRVQEQVLEPADRIHEKLHGDGEEVAGEELPPTAPSRMQQTPPSEPLPEREEPPQGWSSAGGQTRYYAASDILDGKTGLHIVRKGQRIFPDQVTDEGLVVGDDVLPWDNIDIVGGGA